MYDYEYDEWLYDIYRIPGDGYVLCGGQRMGGNSRNIMVVRIDRMGNEIWHSLFGNDGQRHSAYSIIETDDGTFMLAGESAGNVCATHVNDEGEQIWHSNFASGYGDAVIELKGGQYWICGYSERQGYIVCFDIDGNMDWDEDYGGEDREWFHSMRETEGGVVLCGEIHSADNWYLWDFWVVKVDFNGDVIWERTYNFGDSLQYGYSMVSTDDGGFAIGGRIGGDITFDCHFLLVKIDAEGNLEWRRTYELQPENITDIFTCIARLHDGGFALVGGKRTENNYNYGRGIIIRVTPNGQERWHNIYHFSQQEGFGPYHHHFCGVVTSDNDEIIACGSVNYSGEGQNGFVIKLDYDHLEPQFLYYEPEDTVFSVLPGDTVDFLVRMGDQYHEEINLTWTKNGEVVDHDTSVAVPFGDPGEYEVMCVASNEEGFTASITWHVTAVEFYIVDFRPDSTEMTIRRQGEVDFAIDVRALDFEGLGYYWEVVDRDGMQQEIDDSDSVRIQFDLTGDYDVEGVVWRGGNFDMAHWSVTVRSTLWGWLPDDSFLTVPYDTTIDFEVIPFNPASDSLAYYWTRNGEPLDVDTTVSLVTIEFQSVRLETVRCLVYDGCEEDSAVWFIDVVNPHDVSPDPDDLLPESVFLYTPYPNPFNAVTRIAYAMPSDGYVKLAVYDISGRMVGMLVDEDISVGHHICEFDGAELAAGLYFVRLEFESDVLTRKVVVVK